MAATDLTESLPGWTAQLEGARRQLYSYEGVPDFLRKAAEADKARSPPLQFEDHSWGAIPPVPHAAAAAQLYGLQQLGNTAWNVLDDEIIPEAVRNVRSILNLPEDDSVATIQFGHNSHELTGRLISIFIEQLLAWAPEHPGRGLEKLRILTSDQEYYSCTRQLNRFLDSVAAHRFEVVAIPAEPAETFVDRLLEKAESRPFDFVYIAQTTYLTQETLVPDLTAAIEGLHAALSRSRAAAGTEGEALVVVDGYHSFGAFPVNLAPIADNVFFLSAFLKHVGAGANAAFATVPSRFGVRPFLTGWLADPSVLGPDAPVTRIGHEVGYHTAASLGSGTSALLAPLIQFNQVMGAWRALAAVGETDLQGLIAKIHDYIIYLQQRFLAGLADVSPVNSVICIATLNSQQPEPIRSNGLVFKTSGPAESKAAVQALKAAGVQVNSRGQYIRVGFGFNHDVEDVDRLVAAISASSAPADHLK